MRHRLDLNNSRDKVGGLLFLAGSQALSGIGSSFCPLKLGPRANFWKQQKGRSQLSAGKSSRHLVFFFHCHLLVYQRVSFFFMTRLCSSFCSSFWDTFVSETPRLTCFQRRSNWHGKTATRCWQERPCTSLVTPTRAPLWKVCVQARNDVFWFLHNSMCPPNRCTNLLWCHVYTNVLYQNDISSRHYQTDYFFWFGNGITPCKELHSKTPRRTKHQNEGKGLYVFKQNGDSYEGWGAVAKVIQWIGVDPEMSSVSPCFHSGRTKRSQLSCQNFHHSSLGRCGRWRMLDC